ncbi:hypothetical protein [Streptomyces sp. NPDC051014]|uniref:hypothetical protein n=1 Tax=Streptomyces sp. NPDC051014 TaxID=3155751 RepID=UPI0033F1BDF4
MRWSWKAVRDWLAKRGAQAARPAASPSRQGPTAWRRLPVLRTTVRVSPWTVAATARTATARAGTRTLVHRTAPADPASAPRGRVDSLVATAGPVRGRTPGPQDVTEMSAVASPSRAVVDAMPEPGAEWDPAVAELLAEAVEAPRRVPAVAPRQVPAAVPRPATGRTVSPATPAAADTVAVPPSFTRATDEYVGEPRPVTPPPGRSDFDVQLDAYRPAWLVAQMQTGGDLPHYVLARQENRPKSAGAPAVPDREPVLPLPAPPTAPGSPRASLAESRRRAMAHRTGRRPDTRRPSLALGDEADTDVRPDTARDSAATAFDPPFAQDADFETETGPDTDLDVDVDLGSDTDLGPDEPGAEGEQRWADDLDIESGGTPATAPPEPWRNLPATGEESDAAAHPGGPDGAVDTSPTAAAGWETEWSRRQAARRDARRNGPPRGTEQHTQPGASAAGARTAGLAEGEFSSGQGPDPAAESDAPTEDDTSDGGPAQAVRPVFLDGRDGPSGGGDGLDASRRLGAPGTADGRPPTSALAPVSRPQAGPELVHRPGARPSPLGPAVPETVPAGDPDVERDVEPEGAAAVPRAVTEATALASVTAEAARPTGEDQSGAAIPLAAPDNGPAGAGPTDLTTPDRSATPESAVPSAMAGTRADSDAGPDEGPDAVAVPQAAEDRTGVPVTADHGVGPAFARGTEDQTGAADAPATPVLPRVLVTSSRRAPGPEAAWTSLFPVSYRDLPVRSPRPVEDTPASGESRARLVHRGRGSAASVLLPPGIRASESVFQGAALGGGITDAVTPGVAPLAAVVPGVLPPGAVAPGVVVPAATAASVTPVPPGTSWAVPDTAWPGPATRDGTDADAVTQSSPHLAGVSDGDTVLRLVHSAASPVGGRDADTPAAVRTARPRRALYAVPQYVASLFGPPPAAGDSSADPASLTFTGAGQPVPDTDEPEAGMVSAEEMALAVQRAVVGSDLTLAAPAPTWADQASQARARAGARWLGGGEALDHVRAQAPDHTTTEGRTAIEPPHGPEASVGEAPPRTPTTISYGETADGYGYGGPGEQAPAVFSAGAGHPGAPFAGAGSYGGPPFGDGAIGSGVPLERTPEWAALLDMLADREKIYTRFDDPDVLDALAARLYERILAHVRRELVVERERHGLLAPRP